MSKRRIVFLTAAILWFSGLQTFGQERFDDADTNQDQSIDAQELESFFKGKISGFDQFQNLFRELDADGNGTISEQEFANRMAAARKLMNRRTGNRERTGDSKQRANRGRAAALKVGDSAPTFKLKSLDGKSETNLASFRGKKPVVLIFGSYT